MPNTPDPIFSPQNKCLVLRLHRLRHLPPALYATELLVKRGVEVLVVEFGNLKENEPKIPTPIPTIRIAVPSGRLFLSLKPVAIFLGTFFKLAASFIKEGRPRLLIAHGMQEQCLAWLLHFFFRVPVVGHVHEIYSLRELDRFNRLFFWWGLKTLRLAKLLIYPEKNRARIYHSSFKVTTPHEIVYNAPRKVNPIHATDWRKRLSLPDNAVLMGYMGGIGRMQAFEETLLAMVEIPQVHFLIWGWGDPNYLKELKNKARAYRVEARVFFLGETFETKWADLKGCDFSYCIYEPKVLRLQHAATASNKLMEAMAAGIPVLTSDSRDFKEMVSRLDIGVCANPHSPNAIAKALKVLVEDVPRRRLWGENARRAHTENYHYEHQFERALERIVQIWNPEASRHGELANAS